MAIKIYDNYFSLIIKVDSIKRIYGENNFGAFLKEFFPKPVEKRKTIGSSLYSANPKSPILKQLNPRRYVLLMIILSCKALKNSIT